MGSNIQKMPRTELNGERLHWHAYLQLQHQQDESRGINTAQLRLEMWRNGCLQGEQTHGQEPCLELLLDVRKRGLKLLWGFWALSVSLSEDLWTLADFSRMVSGESENRKTSYNKHAYTSCFRAAEEVRHFLGILIMRDDFRKEGEEKRSALVIGIFNISMSVNFLTLAPGFVAL